MLVQGVVDPHAAGFSTHFFLPQVMKGMQHARNTRIIHCNVFPTRYVFLVSQFVYAMTDLETRTHCSWQAHQISDHWVYKKCFHQNCLQICPNCASCRRIMSKHLFDHNMTSTCAGIFLGNVSGTPRNTTEHRGTPSHKLRKTPT